MIKKFKFGGTTFSIDKKGDTVKLVVGKETRYIKLTELWGMAYEFTQDVDLKDKLMPVNKKDIMKFKKVHTVQLKNDMKAGETLQFSCLIDVPTYVIDGFRDIIQKEVPGSGVILNELIPKANLLKEAKA